MNDQGLTVCQVSTCYMEVMLYVFIYVYVSE